MDAVGLMGENIQHYPNLLAEYDDQSYALGEKATVIPRLTSDPANEFFG